MCFPSNFTTLLTAIYREYCPEYITNFTYSKQSWQKLWFAKSDNTVLEPHFFAAIKTKNWLVRRKLLFSKSSNVFITINKATQQRINFVTPLFGENMACSIMII